LQFLTSQTAIIALYTMAEVTPYIFLTFTNITTYKLAECRKRRLNQGSFVLQYFLSFWVVFSSCIFLHCFVRQYRSSDRLWRPPPKLLRLHLAWHSSLCGPHRT